VIYRYGKPSLCVNPGGSASSGEALAVGGCAASRQPGNIEFWPVSGYRSFQFRPLASPTMAIDLSLGGGGGHADGRKIQYYGGSASKENQHWYVLPTMPWDATHGSLFR